MIKSDYTDLRANNDIVFLKLVKIQCAQVGCNYLINLHRDLSELRPLDIMSYNG